MLWLFKKTIGFFEFPLSDLFFFPAKLGTIVTNLVKKKTHSIENKIIKNIL